MVAAYCLLLGVKARACAASLNELTHTHTVHMRHAHTCQNRNIAKLSPHHRVCTTNTHNKQHILAFKLPTQNLFADDDFRCFHTAKIFLCGFIKHTHTHPHGVNSVSFRSFLAGNDCLKVSSIET